MKILRDFAKKYRREAKELADFIEADNRLDKDIATSRFARSDVVRNIIVFLIAIAMLVVGVMLLRS